MIIAKSYKRGAIASTALNAVAKGISFLNIMVIARLYGASAETDLYFYLFAFVNIVATFVNGMDLTVIVPEGMHLRETKGDDAAMRFYNLFAYAYIALGAVVTAVLVLFPLPVFDAISSFRHTELATHRSLLALSGLLAPLLIVSTYLSTVLTTQKFFIAPVLVSLVVQCVTLIMLLLLHRLLGIQAAMLGLVAGYGLNVLLLVALMRFKLNWTFGFSAADLSRRIGQNLFSVGVGNLASTGYSYGIIFILSTLPAGYYSGYNYSMQVVNIPVTFIVAQAAAVVGIKFNELSTKKMYSEINRVFLNSMEVLLFLTIPLCYLTNLYAKDVVEILFFRGDFKRESVDLVANFLRYLIFLTPCLIINTFISRVMTADRKVSQAFYFQVVFNLVSISAIWAGTRFYGNNGFIGATLLTYYLYIVFACSLLFRWVMPYIAYRRIIQTLAASLAFNLPLFFLFKGLFGANQPLFMLVLIGGSYYLALLAINHLIKVNASTYLYLQDAVKVLTLKFKG